jgi:hypothetical protein
MEASLVKINVLALSRMKLHDPVLVVPEKILHPAHNLPRWRLRASGAEAHADVAPPLTV